MSTGARVLYVSLKRRYSPNYKNNGRIYLSQRRAAAEIGSSTNQITRWFRELQHYGFIVQTKPGYLGLEGKGRAAHWRLTEVAYMRGTSSKGMDDMPTMDFLKWNGVRGAVAGLVGIEGGVVSGVINLESSGVEAPDWRPRHDKQYHEA